MRRGGYNSEPERAARLALRRRAMESAAVSADQLRFLDTPELPEGALVLAFSGWMDGGNVSTGAVEWLAGALRARKAAEIVAEGFYIYSFPGSMEISSLFRPHTKVEDGLIKEYEPPTNHFFCRPESHLALFSGKEPHLRWHDFADCLFAFARRTGIATVYFVGSVAGAVPHTREPRLRCTVSDESFKPTLAPYGVRFTDYEGPASFTTYLLTQAAAHGLSMISLVAEIPPYIQGPNPKCIAAMVRKLAALLTLPVELETLTEIVEAWEKRLGEVLADEHELGEHIAKLEADYDNEVFDTQMGDLKEWLEERGIRLD